MLENIQCTSMLYPRYFTLRTKNYMFRCWSKKKPDFENNPQFCLQGRLHNKNPHRARLNETRDLCLCTAVFPVQIFMPA